VIGAEELPVPSVLVVGPVPLVPLPFLCFLCFVVPVGGVDVVGGALPLGAVVVGGVVVVAGGAVPLPDEYWSVAAWR
jgi:hypothetical protein